MAFDFWEAQRKARSKTSWYVAIFLILTGTVAVLAELAMRYAAGEAYQPDFPIVAAIFVGVTVMVAYYEYLMYQSYGGGYVAESVGARLVNPNSQNFKEIQLLNIVKEMATAASLPMPPVYILDRSKEINAFAAGLTPQNAAITVTRGTLNALSREELQGVVAHEMGHIYNGDMKISMRLAAMVMGFFFILYIAFKILQFSGMTRDENKKGGNPVVLAALILAVAGAFTWFFGTVLKAAVSREREYLADACSVQFTRNPNAIVGALKKIAKEQFSDMPKQGSAYSHLYLEDRSVMSSIFATHPPIQKRIEAVLGQKYLPEEWKKDLLGR